VIVPRDECFTARKLHPRLLSAIAIFSISRIRPEGSRMAQSEMTGDPGGGSRTGRKGRKTETKDEAGVLHHRWLKR
jgi:hypothetical protein